VALGIDQLEHGLLTNSEYFSGKQPDRCPTVGDSTIYGNLDINSPDVQRTIREMVAKKVAMTSTLDVFELSSPSRVPFDQRVLDALAPEQFAQVAAYYGRSKTARDSVQRANFKRSMEFERAFVKAGGLLGAGSDPCCTSAIAGYGDQRNYELLIEAGFTPEQAVQIMTSNGAKILGFDKWLGTIQHDPAGDAGRSGHGAWRPRAHAWRHSQHGDRVPARNRLRLGEASRFDQRAGRTTLIPSMRSD
jgi:hypothetical protein